MELRVDPEGYPIMPCQQPVSAFRVERDEDGELLAEYILLPNLLLILRPDHGTMTGSSNMLSPAFAVAFTGHMHERAEHITGCDCPVHEGVSMRALDLATETL